MDEKNQPASQKISDERLIAVASATDALLARLNKPNRFGFTMLDVLRKFGMRMPTPEELAIMCGFNDERVQQLQQKWNAAYDGGLIYISREMVITEFGIANNKSTMSHFNDMLSKQFNKGVDYVIAEHDDELVKDYQKYNPRTVVEICKGGRKPKYIFVTGRTYKRILMKVSTKAGDTQCDYYCDVEDVGAIYKDYGYALNQILVEIARRENEEKDKIIQQQQKSMLRLNTFVNVFTKKPSNQFLYIGTTRQYASQNHFKVGGTVNMKSRFATYGTGRPELDEFYYTYVIRVHNYAHVEKQLETIIGGFKEQEKKEMYVMAYPRLLAIVDLVARGYQDAIELTNQAIDNLMVDMSNQDPIIPEPLAMELDANEIAAPVDQLKEYIKTNSNAIGSDEVKADAARRAHLAGQMMNLLIDGFDFDRDKNVTRMFVWKELSTKIIAAESNSKIRKLVEWREAIKAACGGTALKFKWK